MKTPAAKGKLKFVDPAKFTPHFKWKSETGGGAAGAEVFCDAVSLRAAAQRFGTPLYLYSAAAIAEAFRELDGGLGGLPHTLCFAMKANGNLSILKQLAKLGSGFDIVSGGELEQLRRVGVDGQRIVFSGVGKAREEIRAALEYSGGRRTSGAGILLFNVESEGELEVLQEEAARNVRRGGERPAVSVRVNPDVLAGGHPHIATGLHEHKFGLEWAAARRLYFSHKESKWIRWSGISAHIGSQIVEPRPFAEALKRVVGYVAELKRAGVELRYLDFGGGLGVRYTDEKVPSRVSYARMIAKLVRPTGLHLLLEPGRTIVAAAGVLLTKVLYTKRNRKRSFVVVDAGMNDLMRPALYGAVHPITRVTRGGAAELRGAVERVDVVGPVCETGDCFLRDWPLGAVRAGEVLAIWCVGAYGMSLANNYNGRGRGAEVLVMGAKARAIRRRETVGDLLRGDVLG